jgi:hypothetical protein
MCATEQKKCREVNWRQLKRRTSICAYTIDASEMQWGRIRPSPIISIDCLWCRRKKTFEFTVFISAQHLIDVLDVRSRIKSEKALLGAKDEWLAVQFIPLNMIRQVEPF